jgi:hypothetical protein
MTSSTCQWILGSHDNKGHTLVNMASFQKSIGGVPWATQGPVRSAADLRPDPLAREVVLIDH